MEPTTFAAWAFGSASAVPSIDALQEERPYETPMSARECAESFAALCEAPASLDHRSDAQVACGLSYLLHGEISDFAYLLRDREMPLAIRRRAIAAIGGLYLRQLDRRLGGELIADPASDPSSLRSVVYMLWDVSPLSFWPIDWEIALVMPVWMALDDDHFSGTDTPMLTISNVTCLEHSGEYEAVVTVSCGFVFSQPATLTVFTLGDLNNDCFVNGADLGILLQAWSR